MYYTTNNLQLNGWLKDRVNAIKKKWKSLSTGQKILSLVAAPIVLPAATVAIPAAAATMPFPGAVTLTGNLIDTYTENQEAKINAQYLASLPPTKDEILLEVNTEWRKAGETGEIDSNFLKSYVAEKYPEYYDSFVNAYEKRFGDLEEDKNQFIDILDKYWIYGLGAIALFIIIKKRGKK